MRRALDANLPSDVFGHVHPEKGTPGDAGGMSEAPLRWATSRGNASRHPEVACRIEDNWTISLRHDTLATKRGNETVT